MILLLATEIIVIFTISSELLFSANSVRLAQHEQCWPAVHRSRQGVAFSERILTDSIQYRPRARDFLYCSWRKIARFLARNRSQFIHPLRDAPYPPRPRIAFLMHHVCQFLIQQVLNSRVAGQTPDSVYIRPPNDAREFLTQCNVLSIHRALLARSRIQIISIHPTMRVRFSSITTFSHRAFMARSRIQFISIHPTIGLRV